MKPDGVPPKSDAKTHRIPSERHAVPIPFCVAFRVRARARAALGFSAEEQARFRACCAAFVR